MIEGYREGEWEQEERGVEGGEEAGLRCYLKQPQGDGLPEQFGRTIHQVKRGGEKKSSDKHVTPKIANNTVRC